MVARESKFATGRTTQSQQGFQSAADTQTAMAGLSQASTNGEPPVLTRRIPLSWLGEGPGLQFSQAVGPDGKRVSQSLQFTNHLFGLAIAQGCYDVKDPAGVEVIGANKPISLRVDGGKLVGYLDRGMLLRGHIEGIYTPTSAVGTESMGVGAGFSGGLSFAAPGDIEGYGYVGMETAINPFHREVAAATAYQTNGRDVREYEGKRLLWENEIGLKVGYGASRYNKAPGSSFDTGLVAGAGVTGGFRFKLATDKIESVEITYSLKAGVGPENGLGIQILSTGLKVNL